MDPLERKQLFHPRATPTCSTFWVLTKELSAFLQLEPVQTYHEMKVPDAFSLLASHHFRSELWIIPIDIQGTK